MTRVAAALAALLAAAACQSGPSGSGAIAPLGLPDRPQDLGEWSSGDVAALSDQFAAAVAGRYEGYTTAQAAKDLARQGFVCQPRRDGAFACGKDVWNRACGHIWAVDVNPVFPAASQVGETAGRFAKSCVGDKPEAPKAPGA